MCSVIFAHYICIYVYCTVSLLVRQSEVMNVISTDILRHVHEPAIINSSCACALKEGILHARTQEISSHAHARS